MEIKLKATNASFYYLYISLMYIDVYFFFYYFQNIYYDDRWVLKNDSEWMIKLDRYSNLIS